MTNKPNNLNSVLIPLLRRVMPNIIAEDIVGVQPMTAGPDPEEERVVLEEYPHKAEFFGNQFWVFDIHKQQRINDWVVETWGPEEQRLCWKFFYNTWYFKDPEDLAWFTLKWK